MYSGACEMAAVNRIILVLISQFFAALSVDALETHVYRTAGGQCAVCVCVCVFGCTSVCMGVHFPLALHEKALD